ncbi:MAG: type II secretion system protein [Proteobacteria bacterium]|nr:type II secretion system protein [Burkholderiales bacterium]
MTAGSKKLTGFTLVELVMVLTVVGVLSAVAFPRLASLQADARLDKLHAALGATRSASMMGRALLLARGYPANFTGAATSPPLRVDGVTLEFVHGYPSASVIAELAGLADSTPGRGSYLVRPAAGGSRIVQTDAERRECAFGYTEAAPGRAPAFASWASTSTCE